ncbi:MAG: outer membrane protein assembly factor BamD [Candidatus Thioglobus sp.]|nr:outer membrane protein assembly factor BamD [Candidatus Thioglobus sp.]
MKKTLVISLISLIFLSGCSLFTKDKVKGPVADGLTPKALYDLAQEKQDAGSTNQAIEHLETIMAAYPGSKYSIQARLDIAYYLFKRKEYTRALLELNSFIDLYPAHPTTPYAYYLRGSIAEDQSSSMLDKIVTDSAQRDVQSVRDAYSYYKLLIDTFPASKYSEEAKNKLIKLKNILARHELYVAIYYTKYNSFIAAINRCKYLIEHYPNTPSIPDALHLMARNYDEIMASKLAQDARTILVASYPSYSPRYSLD